MKTWIAILLTVGLAMACALIERFTHIEAVSYLIVGTSVWVGIDSSKIQLVRYKSGISYGPVALGILCAMFWVVAFPWYLSMRYKIKSGEARLRDDFSIEQSSYGQMSPNGLIQPWRGRAL